jgi:hypothetical protein
MGTDEVEVREALSHKKCTAFRICDLTYWMSRTWPCNSEYKGRGWLISEVDPKIIEFLIRKYERGGGKFSVT